MSISVLSKNWNDIFIRRAKELLVSAGISGREFSHAVHRSPSAITQFLAGKTTSVSFDIVQAFLKVADQQEISRAWVLGVSDQSKITQSGIGGDVPGVPMSGGAAAKGTEFFEKNTTDGIEVEPPPAVAAERLGNNCRLLRLAEDLTQDELAARAGLACNTAVSNLESGKTDGINGPLLACYLQLAARLGVPASFLLSDNSPKAIIQRYNHEHPYR